MRRPLQAPRWRGRPGRGPDAPVSPALASSPQELVREMVDADVELMSTNPNA